MSCYSVKIVSKLPRVSETVGSFKQISSEHNYHPSHKPTYTADVVINSNKQTVLSECKPPPRRPTSTKSDTGCSNPDFRIISIQTAAGSLPKCGFITLSFCRVSWKSAGDCMRNANKSPKTPLYRNGNVSGKVIWNPYPGLHHHQKLIRSCDW